MASQQDTPNLTLTAAEALEQYRLVRKDSSGEAVYCDAGEFPLGPTFNRCADGDAIGLALLLNKPGTIKLVASAAMATVGVDVYTAADGKISATNTGVYVGTLLSTASGNNSVVEVLPNLRRVPIVNTAADSVRGATSTDEIDCGITASIPASELKAGSIIRVKAYGIVVDQDSTPQLTLKLYAGTEVICTPLVAAAADNDELWLEAEIVVRTVGASGTLIAMAGWILDAAATGIQTHSKTVATEDTTGGLTIKVSAQFNASHADNQFRLDLLEVEHIR